MSAVGMSADTALRLQAATEHLASAREELLTVNVGPDGSAASQTAALQIGLAGVALASACAGIPAGLQILPLLPSLPVKSSPSSESSEGA